MSSGESVTLPLESRFAGMYVIGRPGTGKTTFLLSLLRQDMENGLGLCFLDPHGDAAGQLLDLVPEKRHRDVKLLDPSDKDYLFGLNLFQTIGDTHPGATADSVVQVFKRAWGGTAWGPRLEDTLYNLAYVMVESGGTLSHCPDFFYDERRRRKRLRTVSNRGVVQYWEHEFGALTPAGQREVRGAVLNKIRQYLSNPLIERVVGALPDDEFDFRYAMDEGKIVVVRLPVGVLGEGTVNLLGSTIIDQLSRSAMSRADSRERRPFVLCADEFQRFATPVFGTLIEEARKYRIATVIAHQRRAQLPEEVRSAVLSVRNLVVFEVQPADARELGREFPDEASHELMSPANLYEILERKGHHDRIISESFGRIKQALDAYPAAKAHEIRAKGHTPDLLMIRSQVEEQKRYLSQLLASLQDGRGWVVLPIWRQFKDDITRLKVGLELFPIKVPIPHQPKEPELALAGLPPFTAKVKYIHELEMREATIRTGQSPAGKHWRPDPNLTRWTPGQPLLPSAFEPDEDDEDDLFFDESSKDDAPPISEPYKPR